MRDHSPTKTKGNMRSILSAALLTLALAFAPSAKAQSAPDTNAPPDLSTNAPLFGGPGAQLFNFLSTGSNWMIAPYGIVSTEHKVGGGVAFGYKLSPFIVPLMRLDYFNGTLWMPSMSLQLQVPFTIMGKFTVVPFTSAGLATPLAGAGTANGSAVGIFALGAAVRISSRFDIVGDYEKWSGFKGAQIRAGILYKF
jgi:hypothetical protein